MNTTSLKKLLDTCFIAKRIVETLPELPKGMKPRHIHVLDAIQEIQQMQGMCRVSDVSNKLDITMPSVTKLIQELEVLGMVQKQMAQDDKRVSLLLLTENGQACLKRHVTEFHSAWVEKLNDISDERVEEVIYVIEQLRQTMPGGKEGKHRNGK